MIMKNTKRIRVKLQYLAAVLLLACPLRSSAYNVKGDIDNSGKADISDVTVLINKLLTHDIQWSYDITGDGKVNIADVTALINYLLTGEWPWADIEGPAMPDNAVVYMVNGYRIVMVPVEGGTFMMGSDISGELASPVHEVTLSDYSIGMTEVTNGLWKAVTGSYPVCYTEALDNDNTPVSYCSWDMAKEFITQLNGLTGLAFRLPTEAQWEFAARGGNLSKGYLYSGSDDIDEVAWYHTSTLQHEVGLKKPNELGLYDMSGNMMEFCEDDYTGYHSEPQVDPLYNPDPLRNKKIVRGGSAWTTFAYECTVSTRKRSSYQTQHGVNIYDAGFRLAL